MIAHSDSATPEAAQTTFTISRERRDGRNPVRLDGATQNPALAAAIERVAAAAAIAVRLGDAHTAAEEAEIAAQGSAVSAEVRAAAKETADTAHDVWMAQLDKLDIEADLLAKIEVTDPADFRLQLRAYAWAHGHASCLTLSDVDQTACLEITERFVGHLIDDPTPPPAGGDVDLLALGSAFEAAWAEERAYDISQGDEGYEALLDRTVAIGDQIMLSPPATTDAGRRIKALVVQHCQTNDLSDPVEFITGETMSDLRCAQIIINELLGLKERPAEERRADEEAARSALEQALRVRGQQAPCERQDWRIAKARVEDALAEQDRLYAAAQSLEDAGATEEEVNAAHDELEQFSPTGPWRAMMDTPAPTIEAVSYKLRALLDRGYTSHIGDDVDTPETISKLLAEHPIDGAAPIVRIYQDVLRLCGDRPDLVAAQPDADEEPSEDGLQERPALLAAE